MMTAWGVALFLAAGWVAFTNGANANFKGVASLYGSGTTTLRRALLWGTLTTFLGSVAAFFLADTLLKNFGGRGLVSDALVAAPEFLFAVASGAAFTSFLGTRLGFPVSTTHALVGALVGAGLAHSLGEVHWEALGKNFLQPLLLSPLVAMALGGALAAVSRLGQDFLQRNAEHLEKLHFLSAGASSFSRGLNDTPKMAALLLGIHALDPSGTFVPTLPLAACVAAIAVLIAGGALVDAENVAETLGKKVTGMSPSEGFAANLSTALLVTTASLHGLPASTTHVSVGSMLGMGIVNGRAHWKSVGQIALAWIVTLPCAALLAALVYSVAVKLAN
jgi:PiT family inorganic phosphate transporter